MSIWATISTISLTALMAMGRIFLVSLVGYFCALYPKSDPLLSPQTVKILSRISNMLFLPCLIVYSLGSGLSLKLFSEMSIMIPFCFLNEAIAYAIAFTIGRVIQEDDKELSTAVSVAIGSPNVISFPLMVMETLCKQSEQVKGDFVDSETCFVEATSTLFVYSIAWHFVFWGFGYPRLQTLLPAIKNAELGSSSQDDVTADDIEMVSLNADMKKGEPSKIKVIVTEEKTLLQRFCGEILRVMSIVITSPPIISTCIGILLGVASPIRNALFKDFTFLTPFGSALATVAQPIICLNCLIMSSSLATVRIFPVQNVKSNESSDSKNGSNEQVLSNTNSHQQYPQESLDRFSVGQYAADGISFNSYESTGPRKRSASESDLSETRQSYSRMSVSEPIERKTSSVLPKIQEEDTQNTTRKESDVVSPPKSRTIAAMILCRLIIAPALMLPLCHYCVKSGWMSGKERTFMLVVVLEAAAPSAQMMIVALSQLGLAKVASQIAYLYVFQYSSAILTITFWTTLTISLLY